MVNSRHDPDPSEVQHLTEMFMATLNPYFAWAVARLCYEDGLELPHEVLIYFGTAATALIGEDTAENRRPEWGADRDSRVSYEKALHFDQQRRKLEQYNDLKDIGSDRAAKWFADDMLRLIDEERRNGARTKDDIYLRIGKRVGLSESAVKKLCLKAERGEDFDLVLDRRVVNWGS